MATVSPINPESFALHQYTNGDASSLPSVSVPSTFSTENGRVESLIYDLGRNLIQYNSNAKYSIIENGGQGDVEFADALLVYPKEALTDLSINEGSYNVVYHFLNNELKSSSDKPFRIKEISSNRRELRLTTAFLEAEDLEFEVNQFYPETNTSGYYPDFYLNLGQGNLALANNILYDNTNNQYSILVKLYQPLPSFVQVGNVTWVNTLQRDTVAYNVEFEEIILPVKNTVDIKGPNFSLDLNTQIHSSVKPTSISDLNNTAGISTSSFNQLQNILNQKGVEINIDYTDFNNFIHFSSAERRIRNFKDKVGLINHLSSSIADSGSANFTGVSQSRAVLSEQITNVIKNFDGFEYFMYFTSESNGLAHPYPKPYPKTNSLPPFTLASTESADAVTWFNNSIESASLFDDENQDNLYYTIPNYILEDSSNDPYIKFIEMIGQHFDTLFTYAQDITNRYNADNRLDFGISKDLVGEAIKSMGVNLYAGNFTAADLYSSFTGINASDSYLPPFEDGQVNVSNYVTASNDPTPIEDVNKEIYKRIYHNLPLLLKQKGSVAGLKTLTNCFGVPREILPVKEFNIRYQAVTQSLPELGVSSITMSIGSEVDIVLPQSHSNYIPNTLLSPVTTIQQDTSSNDSAGPNFDIHYAEVGFSPQGYIDQQDNSGFEPLAHDFPHYDDFVASGSYYSSKFNDLETAGTELNWDVNAFIRYVKFFDSSLFQMIKDFTPVRTSLATGVTIKPTIKERQKYSPKLPTIEDLSQHSGSAYTEYYDWEASESVYRKIGDYDARIKTGSFTYAGGTGGGFDSSNRYEFATSGSPIGSATDETDWGGRDLATPISSAFRQVWSESVYGYDSLGVHELIHTSQDEFYNGIFKQTGQASIDYLTRETNFTSSDVGFFKYDNNPTNPYKKDSGNTQYSITFNNLYDQSGFQINATILAAANSAAKVYYVPGLEVLGVTEFDLLYISHDSSAGDGKLKTIIEGNGTTLTIGSYTWQILSVSEIPLQGYSLVSVSQNYLSGSRSALAAGGSVGVGTIFPNWDPFSALAILTNDPGPYDYSEFNPLVNNTSDPGLTLENYEGIRKSEIYMDADYSPSASSSINPINQGLIEIGSASKAAVQDSNYYSNWWSGVRYNGIRRSSPNFNVRIPKVVTNISNLFSSESLGVDLQVSSSNPIFQVTGSSAAIPPAGD